MGKLPSFNVVFVLIIVFFLLLVLLAAAGRKYKLCVVLCVLLLAVTVLYFIGGRSLRYERAPEHDISILDVDIRDDGMFYHGKKLEIMEMGPGDTLKAYRAEYTIPLPGLPELEAEYVYSLN